MHFIIIIAMAMLLRGFGPYVILFMNACVVITIAMIVLLKDFEPYWIIFTMFIYYYSRYHGSNVNGFWSLQYNIYKFACYNHCYDSVVKGL